MRMKLGVLAVLAVLVVGVATPSAAVADPVNGLGSSMAPTRAGYSTVPVPNATVRRAAARAAVGGMVSKYGLRCFYVEAARHDRSWFVVSQAGGNCPFDLAATTVVHRVGSRYRAVGMLFPDFQTRAECRSLFATARGRSASMAVRRDIWSTNAVCRRL